MNEEEVPPPLLLSLEGNIGAGKTTFLRLLRDSLEIPVEVIEEPVSQWKCLSNSSSEKTSNLLQLFYEDPGKWGYAFQSYCFFTRLREFQQMKENSRIKPGVLYIFERSIHSDRNIFALNAFQNKLINEIEWKSYNYLFELITKNLDLSYDAMIYLDVSPEKCYKRIVKRGRPEENDLPLEYLTQIHEKHENWLKTQEKPVLKIDWEDFYDENAEKQKELAAKIRAFLGDKFKKNAIFPQK